MEPNYTSIWNLKGKIVIIAEKPKAASKIAYALSDNPVFKKIEDVPYYEIREKEVHIIVASAVGHLYELYSNTIGYPVFDYKWVPAYIADSSKDYARKYLNALSIIFRDASFYINACDYDIEGSVIGYMLIKHYGNEKRAFRAKFSSLVFPELKAAFTRLTSLDYNMIEAGLCRHELDWLWGINISRALMKSVYVSTGKKITLSAGRVQTPTLKYIVDREIERRLFIPLPQYNVSVTFEKDNVEYYAESILNPIENENKANEIKKLVEEQPYLIVKDISTREQKYYPPPPFNLSDLQSQAATIYGFSPMKTMEIAEQLYLDALISYPRTNSQKLPSTLNFKEILNRLAQIQTYRDLVNYLFTETKGLLKPVEGEKEDPAHPAIYPTGVKPRELTDEQRVIYDLIVRRFLAAFVSPAIVSQVNISITTPDYKHVFTMKGLNILRSGWLKYYPFHNIVSKALPVLKQGEKLNIRKVNIHVSYTKPPPRLKKIDVLKWMERVNIGTESTRAIIIEKLFDRNYLTNTKSGIEVKDLGIGVIKVIEEFFPDLTSTELTRKFELLMTDVIKGNKKRDEVIREAKNILSNLLAKFNENLNIVGVSLARRIPLIQNLNKCIIPNCREDAYIMNLCRYHYKAYRFLLDKYTEWNSRKPCSPREYLSKISGMKYTGRYVKEVIQHYKEDQLEAELSSRISK